MTRALNATNLAALESASVSPIYFLELEIDTTVSPEVWVRLHTGLGTITTNTSPDAPGARAFSGAGTLLSFDSVKEVNTYNPMPLVATLSGVDSSVTSLVFDQDVWRRPCRLYLGALDNGALVADPDVIFSGFIEKLDMVLAAPEGDTVKLTAENELILLKRSRDLRYTDRQLQSEFSGDLGFEFLESVAQTNVVWRGRQNRMGRFSGGLPGAIKAAAEQVKRGQ